MVQANDDNIEFASTEHGNNYMICVDGSNASELAYTIAVTGLYRPGKDEFNICTITNHEKTDLPFNFKPEHIENHYQNKIFQNRQAGNAKFIKKEVDPGKTTKDTLWSLAKIFKADIIVLGICGRKGQNR